MTLAESLSQIVCYLLSIKNVNVFNHFICNKINEEQILILVKNHQELSHAFPETYIYQDNILA